MENISEKYKTAPWFECTPWSKPWVIRRYKYKGYIIEYIEQSCHNHCSVYHHHEFRALKDDKIVTKGHMRYSECTYHLKKLIENGK
jgi:hypothetical protein